MSGESPVGTPLIPHPSSRITVLFLAGESPPRPGGVGDYTALLAHPLADQDIRVVVLATRDIPQSPPAAPRDAPPAWRAVRRWDWACGPTVLAAARAARADVVHVQYQPA